MFAHLLALVSSEEDGRPKHRQRWSRNLPSVTTGASMSVILEGGFGKRHRKKGFREDAVPGPVACSLAATWPARIALWKGALIWWCKKPSDKWQAQQEMFATRTRSNRICSHQARPLDGARIGGIKRALSQTRCCERLSLVLSNLDRLKVLLMFGRENWQGREDIPYLKVHGPLVE